MILLLADIKEEIALEVRELKDNGHKTPSVFLKCLCEVCFGL